MNHRIHVRISASGEITVEAEGVQGKGCEAATKAIEEALGKSRSRSRKPDFWRQSSRHQTQQRVGGGES